MATGEKAINKYEKLLSEEEWLKLIRNKLQTSNFELIETNIGPLSEDQVGFMGDHLKLSATILLHEKNQKKDLQFFAKVKPLFNKSFREYVDEIKGFEKEIGFFENLLPALNKYIIKNKEVNEIEDNSLESWVCEYYFSRPDIVILEDLFAHGFKHTDSRSPMDYDHCIITLQTLARFHAASIIFEQNRSETSVGKVCQIYETFQDILFETEWVTTEGHPGNKFMKASIKGMVSMLDYLPNYGKNYENFEKIKKELPQVLEQMCENVKPSKRYRNVICHGDLWVNNIFFRYNKENKPIAVRIVDFQLIRYNPPANEIMWFLHLVTRPDFRETNLDSFLNAYYTTFSSELLRHKLNPNELLSWSEFKESCDCYKNSGRLAVAMYFQQCMMTGEYLKGIFSDPYHMITFQTGDKSKYLIDCYHKDPVFRERNAEVIEEVIKYCILQT